MRTHRAIVYSLAALLFVVLTGCAGSLPPTNYYVLGLPVNPPPPGKPVLPYSIAIGDFDAQPPLVRRNIIWRSGEKVGLYTYDKWAELPSQVFRDQLYRRASESDLFHQVRYGTFATQADFLLEGMLTDFEEITTPQGTFGKVAVQANLTDKSGNQIWSGEVENVEPLPGEGGAAAAKAINVAAEQTVSKLLQDVSKAIQTHQSATSSRE